MSTRPLVVYDVPRIEPILALCTGDIVETVKGTAFCYDRMEPDPHRASGMLLISADKDPQKPSRNKRFFVRHDARVKVLGRWEHYVPRHTREGQ